MQTPTITDQQIDLLVDGELAVADQQQLLRQIEQQPDAWKRVALAYVESQTLSTHLCEQFHAPAIQSPQLVTTEPNSSRSKAAKRNSKASYRLPFITACCTTLVLAIAASFFGWKLWKAETTSPSNYVENKNSNPANSEFVNSETPNSANPAMQVDDSNLRLIVNTKNEGPREIDVPLIDGSKVDRDWMYQTPNSVTPELHAMLKQTGYRLNQIRKIVPIQLEDGRTVVLPVDNFELQYIGTVPQ